MTEVIININPPWTSAERKKNKGNSGYIDTNRLDLMANKLTSLK